MGNTTSEQNNEKSKHLSSSKIKIKLEEHTEKINGFSRYNEKELTLLDRMFQDLAKRNDKISPGPTMSKETFLEYFGMPGILGERLFNLFDSKKQGVIDFEEFVNGLARYNRGSMEDKINMLFDMYDLDGHAYVTPEELSIILFSLITPTTTLFFDENKDNEPTPQKGGLIGDKDKVRHISKVTSSTVEKLVKEAFEQCDKECTGKLSREQFREWVTMHPEALQMLETVFVKHVWSGWSYDDDTDIPHHEHPSNGLDNLDNDKNDSEDSKDSNKGQLYHRSMGSKHGDLLSYPITPRVAIPLTFHNLYEQLKQRYMEDAHLDAHTSYTCEKCNLRFYTTMYVEDSSNSELNKYVLFQHGSNHSIQLEYCPQCGSHVVRQTIKSYLNLYEAIQKQHITQQFIQKEGKLYKIGKQIHVWIERYYVVKDKFLYCYKKKDDEFPTNVFFISGWFISPFDDFHKPKGYWGIELQPAYAAASQAYESKKLYCKSEKERDEWCQALQEAARTVAIESIYKIGRILGKGHFSIVHECENIRTNKKYAIKVVEKSRIDSREKESLRSEIAIMKLVNHPCIIHMTDVYEDKKCIYMVMTLVKHGDFFARWESRKSFAEDTVRIIIWKLLDAIHYLHSLGIVHRDLKPENILCTSEDDDTAILISDFGLSKFAAPHTEMTMSCGTLAYVAPEVLRQQGYSRKVDLWSLGCIMHLLLRGILPFDGHTKEQIIDRTLNKELVFNHPLWQRSSEDAKDLLTKLLTKDPINRIDLVSAQNHKWFEPLRKSMPLDNMHYAPLINDNMIFNKQNIIDNNHDNNNNNNNNNNNTEHN